MSIDDSKEIAAVERPRSVGILAGLQFVQSLGLMAFGYMQIVNHVWPEAELLLQPEAMIPAFFDLITSGIGLFVLGALMFIVSIELLRLRNWAWLASMSVQGLTLASSLLAYIRQEPNYLAMVLGVILVFYLNQAEVQDAFRRKREQI